MTRTPPVVVAAAILDDGDRLLAAQRAYPPQLRGRWELPGGKVHAGESDRDALVRECQEELGVTVEPSTRAAADVPTVDGTAILRTYWARITAGTPEPSEHLAIRWLAAGDLDAVEWLEADLPVIADIRRHITSAS